MRPYLPGALILVLLALLVPVGGATHSANACPDYSTTGIGGVGLASTTVGVSPTLQIYVSAAKGNFYIVNDAVLSGDWVSSLWIYQETNGAGGLQRHDEYCTTPGYDADELRDIIIW